MSEASIAVTGSCADSLLLSLTTDQADDSFVSNPMLHKLDQPIMLEFVEKGPNVQVQNPVHFLPHNPHP
jgi:hypothetical protein